MGSGGAALQPEVGQAAAEHRSKMLAPLAHHFKRALVEAAQGRDDLLAAIGALIAERRRQEMQLQRAQHPHRLELDDDLVDAARPAPFDETGDQLATDGRYAAPAVAVSPGDGVAREFQTLRPDGGVPT